MNPVSQQSKIVANRGSSSGCNEAAMSLNSLRSTSGITANQENNEIKTNKNGGGTGGPEWQHSYKDRDWPGTKA